MDIRLHYTEAGSGSPFILLHGNGEDGTYFRHQIKYFSKIYRVIALDTRGHGKSPRGEMPFTIRQFAEDLREFMDGQEIDRADILGFSDGGNIALIFALRYPERINRLILNGANLYGTGVKPSVQVPYEILFRAQKALLHLTKERGWKKIKHSNELLSLMVNDPNIRPEELAGNTNPDFLRMKKLVIAGDRDMIKDEHTRLIYACLPNAELKILHGNHFIAAEYPDEFNRVVGEFLDS